MSRTRCRWPGRLCAPLETAVEWQSRRTGCTRRTRSTPGTAAGFTHPHVPSLVPMPRCYTRCYLDGDGLQEPAREDSEIKNYPPLKTSLTLSKKLLFSVGVLLV